MIGDHNLKISEQDYRNLDLPSYSMLSSISKGGIDVMNGTASSMFTLKFGSLVDDMCFDPDNVTNKYYLAGTVKNPTPNVKAIVDQVISALISTENNSESFSILKKRKLNTSSISTDLKDHQNLIVTAAKVNNVYQGYSLQKLMETVLKAGQQYFKDSLDSRGKILIKQDMWDKSLRTAMTLATHNFSREYFVQENGIEFFYQYKFVTEVNGLKTKGMLDIVKVDHNTKTIHPVDLKTGELPVSKFPEIMLMYGYYIQACLYREALLNIVENDPDLEGYTVANFEFLYISKENPDKPLVFVVTDRINEAALKGFTDRYGAKHKGVFELLKEYYDCKRGMYCQYTEEEYALNGKIPFDDDLIKSINDEN